MARLALLLAALAPIASACHDDARRTAPPERAHDLIVFSVNDRGWGEVWTMQPDGTDRRRLTPRPRRPTDSPGSGNPAWSPDGRTIAFARTGRAGSEADREIWLMNADGGDKRRLTRNDVRDDAVAWSPDGTRLAVARHLRRGTENLHGTIVVIDVATRGERVLVEDRSPSYVSDVAWSRDGQRIAFARTTLAPNGVRTDVHVVDADGGEPKLLAEDATDLAWAPDGTRLAFASFRDRFGATCFHECAPSGEIYVATADGSDTRRITRSEASDDAPTWSPDGSRLVFVSDRSNRDDHEYELWIVDARGGKPTRLTRNRVWDMEPDWR